MTVSRLSGGNGGKSLVSSVRHAHATWAVESVCGGGGWGGREGFWNLRSGSIVRHIAVLSSSFYLDSMMMMVGALTIFGAIDVQHPCNH
jgi:hypothetical protein